MHYRKLPLLLIASFLLMLAGCSTQQQSCPQMPELDPVLAQPARQLIPHAQPNLISPSAITPRSAFPTPSN